MNKPKESDWKRYSAKVDEWRERLLAGSNDRLLAILKDSERNQTDRFWDANEQMKKEYKIVTSILGHHSRSWMFETMLGLYQHGVIEEAELDEFSAELQESLRELRTPKL